MILTFLTVIISIILLILIIRLYLGKCWGSVDKSNEICVQGKIVIVTGASSGIGKYTALELVRRGATVVLACRNLEAAEMTKCWILKKTGFGKLVILQFNLESLESVRNFCKTFKSQFDHLDILINNAGVVFEPHEPRKTQDGFEIHFGVNYLSHFLLTNLLLDLLKKGAPSRIVNVSSLTHNWGSLDFDDLMLEKKTFSRSISVNLPYANSKLAIVHFNKELAKRLEGSGVTAYALCPGVVATNLLRNVNLFLLKIPLLVVSTLFFKSSAQGSATTIHCAMNRNLVNESGEMYRHCGKWDPKDRVELKDEDSRRLWEISSKLVGL